MIALKKSGVTHNFKAHAIYIVKELIRQQQLATMEYMLPKFEHNTISIQTPQMSDSQVNNPEMRNSFELEKAFKCFINPSLEIALPMVNKLFIQDVVHRVTVAASEAENAHLMQFNAIA